ncbi:hypothetical protein AB1Y20_011915 [Prymnesium parvum]|uniref:VPS9 domain-containing protein n=1 Tax=Prymnesium parvum TaxID=97485 RepID=A0AB34IPD4_PRYPA
MKQSVHVPPVVVWWQWRGRPPCAPSLTSAPPPPLPSSPNPSTTLASATRTTLRRLALRPPRAMEASAEAIGGGSPSLFPIHWPKISLRPPNALTAKPPPTDFTRSALMRDVHGFFSASWAALASDERSAGEPNDLLQLGEQGPRISYSRSTAEWMAEVARTPSNPHLVANHLNRVLGSDQHPLGRVLSGFVGLVLDHLMERGVWEKSREASAALRSEAFELAQVSAACIHEGCARLHRLVLDMFPPLQAEPARRYSLEAVLSVVFDQLGAPLMALVRRIYAKDDAVCQSSYNELLRAGLLPSHLDIPEQFWLKEEARPYAPVIDCLQSLPLLQSPRQKLQLFHDACAEVSPCVQRYHQQRGGMPLPPRRTASPSPHASPSPSPSASASPSPSREPSGVSVLGRTFAFSPPPEERPSPVEPLDRVRDALARRLPPAFGRAEIASPPVEIAPLDRVRDALARGLPPAFGRAEIASPPAVIASHPETASHSTEIASDPADIASHPVEIGPPRAQPPAVGGTSADMPSNEESKLALGAEELIPLMAYALVHAQLSHLVSEVRFIEIFLCPTRAYEAQLMLGPLGYCLATLNAAVELVRTREHVLWEQLSPKQPPRAAEEIEALALPAAMTPAVESTANRRPSGGSLASSEAADAPSADKFSLPRRLLGGREFPGLWFLPADASPAAEPPRRPARRLHHYSPALPPPEPKPPIGEAGGAGDRSEAASRATPVSFPVASKLPTMNAPLLQPHWCASCGAADAPDANSAVAAADLPARACAAQGGVHYVSPVTSNESNPPASRPSPPPSVAAATVPYVVDSTDE